MSPLYVYKYMSIIDDLRTLTGKKENAPLQVKSSQLGTVLIVEDEKALADVLEDRLTREGYHVIKAANGEEGLQLAQSYHPRIILLDLLMPVMNGKSMLIKLRELPDLKKTPVIVLTNAGEVENIQVTQHYFNAVDFLIKSNVTLDFIVKRLKEFTY